MAPNDNNDNEDDYEEDFDDDDDSDEGDFVPGADDDSDDEAAASTIQVQGTLRLDADDKLVLSSSSSDNGLGVVVMHVVSTEPLTVDLASSSTSEPLVVVLEGTLDVEASPTPPRRKLQLTFVAANDSMTNGTPKKGGLKSTGDDEDEEDAKKPAATTAGDVGSSLPAAAAAVHVRHYQVFGRELLDSDKPQAELLELKGSVAISKLFHSDKEPVSLVCDARLVSSKPAAAATTTASPAVAAARKSDLYHGDNDDDDEDDLDADADDEVDYDELIALHEEAGLPVEQLRKRLQQQEDDDNDKKRAKPSAQEEEEDYDGF